MLEEDGKPAIVERARIVPPRSRLGPVTPQERKAIVDSSIVAGHYEKAVDRESAYEKLQARAGQKAEAAGAASTATEPGAGGPSVFGKIESVFKPTIGPRGAIHDSVATTMAKSAMRAASTQMGRQIMRGLMGSLFGGSGGRR
jgi:DNA helicase HerA-like ATPase